MTIKIVVADPKTGKSYQAEIEQAELLHGKRIGAKVDGGFLNLAGYELEIMGGSDLVGNPMRADVDGGAARRLLLTDGVGFNATRKGERRKKRVIGRIISGNIVQVNTKVVKAGTQSLDKVLGKKEEGAEDGDAPAEEKKEAKAEVKEEAPKEEKKEAEEKKEESKPEEKPAEEKKEESKPEVKEESKSEEPPKDPSLSKPQTGPNLAQPNLGEATKEA